jgi:hypothetical protein
MLALKILGKLGGSSRRAFMDAQNFTYVDLEDIGRSIGPRALYAAGYSAYRGEPPKLCIQSELTIVQKPDTVPGNLILTVINQLFLAAQITDPVPQKRKIENGAETDESAPKRQQLDEEKDKEKTETPVETEVNKVAEEPEQPTEPPKLQVSAQLPMAQLVESALSMIRSSMVTEPLPPLHLK